MIGDVEEFCEDVKDIFFSILEKGIIYFFFCGWVGIDWFFDVDEIVWSYIIFRLIVKDVKFGSGFIGDVGNSRVCVVFKKVFLKMGKDRWIFFVEKIGVFFSEFKDEFFKLNDYEIKIVGIRYFLVVIFVVEGVYVIISIGKDSYLVYILIFFDKFGEV